MQRTFQAAVSLVQPFAPTKLTLSQRVLAVRASRQHVQTSAVRYMSTTPIRQGKPRPYQAARRLALFS